MSGKLDRRRVTALCVLVSSSGLSTLPAAGAEEVSFALDVVPILQSRCIQCHSPDGPGLAASGLDLRSYESVMKGTKHGPIVTPGNALTSNLVVLVDGRADPSIRMPHNQRPLLRAQVGILRDWIQQGAKNN